MTIREREDICRRIANAIIRNYDEVTDHDEPYIALSLDEGNFELPKQYKKESNKDYVDELWGDLAQVKSGQGVYLAISTEIDDCYERADEIELDDLDDEFLLKIVEYAEAHKGNHYGEENFEKM